MKNPTTTTTASAQPRNSARQKLYYVAKVRPYHGGAWRTEKTNRPVERTFWQAVTNLDVLSCGALWPVVRAEATNQRDALRIGKAKVAEIIAAQNP